MGNEVLSDELVTKITDAVNHGLAEAVRDLFEAAPDLDRTVARALLQVSFQKAPNIVNRSLSVTDEDIRKAVRS